MLRFIYAHMCETFRVCESFMLVLGFMGLRAHVHGHPSHVLQGPCQKRAKNATLVHPNWLPHRGQGGRPRPRSHGLLINMQASLSAKRPRIARKVSADAQQLIT